jgi:CheY-like chemotaxis protein/anti-sigma regulatory factor (Ser/Thr protein kinase)
VRIETSVVNLATVTSAALDGVRLAAAAKGIRLESDLGDPADQPIILGDASRLQQVIWNLLTNAIKFTSGGGVVEVVVKCEDESVSLSVKDSGIGIPASFLPYVFEPFRQAESSSTRTHGGLGLGLSIVRHLVEMHGGRMRAASEGEGRGALFTVELPRLKPSATEGNAGDAAEARDAAIDGAAMPDLTGVSVLTIDDQPRVCEFFMAVLSRCGADVRCAESVREGKRAIETQRADVILCDIAMPQEDGFVFIEWVKQQPWAGEVPVIAVTAFGRPEDEQRTRDGGFSGYLRKPVEPLELSCVVAAAAVAGAHRPA